MRQEEIVQDIILRSYVAQIPPSIIIQTLLSLGFDPQKCYHGAQMLQDELKDIKNSEINSFVRQKLEALEGT